MLNELIKQFNKIYIVWQKNKKDWDYIYLSVLIGVIIGCVVRCRENLLSTEKTAFIIVVLIMGIAMIITDLLKIKKAKEENWNRFHNKN